MNRLAGTIVAPNVERALERLDSLADAQSALEKQLENLQAALVAPEPLETDLVARVATLRKRLATVDATLATVRRRIDEILKSYAPVD